MAEFQIFDLSQTEPYEIPEGDYKLSYVGADGDEYSENYRNVQIDFAAQVVTVWASKDRLKGKRLAFYPRERVVRVRTVIA